MSKLVKLIPIAIKIAQAIEALMPGGGQGKTKFGIALKIAGAGWDSSADVRKGWDDRGQFSENMGRAIDAAVKLMNDEGVFKKGKTTA